MTVVLATAGWAEDPHSWDGIDVGIFVVLVFLNLLFFGLAFGIWRFIHRRTPRNRRFTLDAMYLLTTLLRLPIWFFVVSAPVMYEYSIYTIELIFR